MELSKPVKIAYDLNDECLNPQAIEKVKVSLAVRIFGELIRNAFTYYVKNGQPEWEGTLKFLKLTLYKKMKFFIKDFFSKCDQICRKLQIWLHLLKKYSMEIFICCAALSLVVVSTKCQKKCKKSSYLCCPR